MDDLDFDIAIEGCAHGELDSIYDMILHLNKENQKNVKLLICCGDFQSVRNNGRDLKSMAVLPKYQKLNSFHYYYQGIKTAPILTIFIGGNHEASEYLWELPYGGWVASNIYYMGWSNVIKFVIQYKGNSGNFYQKIIRIAGLSGIFKRNHYVLGHYECPPFNEDTKRSIYHVRNFDIFKLNSISRPIDIFISHDWPLGIYNHGNISELLSRKPFFRADIERGELGSPASWELLQHLKPSYWFAAHLHVKFAAIVNHNPTNESSDEENTTETNNSTTKFLALDKCLPNRKYLQLFPFKLDPKVDKILEKVNPKEDFSIKFSLAYDNEWLAILQKTNDLLNTSKCHTLLPNKPINIKENKLWTSDQLIPVPLPSDYNEGDGNNHTIFPCYKNFQDEGNRPDPNNVQTLTFCECFSLTNPCSQQMKINSTSSTSQINKRFKPNNSNTPTIPANTDSDKDPLFDCFNDSS